MARTSGRPSPTPPTSAPLSATTGRPPGLGGAEPHQYAPYTEAFAHVAPQPTLYLRGENDGCISSKWSELALDHLGARSRTGVVAGTGHFLHLEKPTSVNAAILDWLVD